MGLSWRESPATVFGWAEFYARPDVIQQLESNRESTIEGDE